MRDQESGFDGSANSHRLSLSESPDQVDPVGHSEPNLGVPLQGWRWWRAMLLVLAAALVVLIPTTGDIGLTWDEPAYRHSQVMSAQWWEQVFQARTWNEIRELLDPDVLLYYWPYGRYGINFHPPLAGQLNLATHALFGSWMKDIPSRRLATVIEFAVTVALGFGFLARRYGILVGLTTAGSLLFLPRLYGQAHLIDTDIPGLLLWGATAIAFWKGVSEPDAVGWRVLVGVLLGLAFVEKMAAVGVLLPLGLWLAAVHLPRALHASGGRQSAIDGIVTWGLMLLPLGLGFLEIQALQRQLPLPRQTDLFVHRPKSDLPGWILAIPLLVWWGRQLLFRVRPASKVWGVRRPALETISAILAFAPLVGWLGNPAWWSETFPRLAHYYALNTNRRGALPDIQIIYFGQIYEYSLPWHNAWVLIAITVPVGILLASLVGGVWGIFQVRRDRLPIYFLVHLVTLPVLRMLPTPAHDGVRLFLPTFFFLACFSGWGTLAAADALSRWLRVRAQALRIALAGLVVGTAAYEVAAIHPFELSYYNMLIGGPQGAWQRGFELTYWFDAFNGDVIEKLNRTLPPNAVVEFPNVLTNPMTFQELQHLGVLRSDIVLGSSDKTQFPYVWLQTQDSKATAFSRLLFAMKPWFAVTPRQLGGLRVATVADPVAVSRAWALQVLLDAPDRSPPDPPAAPAWVQAHAPFLGRLWGDGLTRIPRLALHQEILEWANREPQSLLRAAEALARCRTSPLDPEAQRLLETIVNDADPETAGTRQRFLDRLLTARPEALVEGVQILIRRREAVVAVMTRPGYTDPAAIGGFLDQDLPRIGGDSPSNRAQTLQESSCGARNEASDGFTSSSASSAIDREPGSIDLAATVRAAR